MARHRNRDHDDNHRQDEDHTSYLPNHNYNLKNPSQGTKDCQLHPGGRVELCGEAIAYHEQSPELIPELKKQNTVELNPSI